MKKLVFTILLALCALSAQSQSKQNYVVIHFSDGDSAKYLREKIDSINFVEEVKNDDDFNQDEAYEVVHPITFSAPEILKNFDPFTHFNVYAEKYFGSNTTTTTQIFPGYIVSYTANSAGTTQTNTCGWEYVGLGNSPQTIKYWDKAASKYIFTGISTARDDINSGKITISRISPTSTSDQGKYIITISQGAQLDSVFVSDCKEVTSSDYEKDVQLRFRPFAAKVRFGCYESIPGYSVKIDNIQSDFQCYDGQNAVSVNVTYQPNLETLNQPCYEYSGATSAYTFGSIWTNGDVLGTSSSSLTFDQNEEKYASVYPNEKNDKDMIATVDYTLTSTDGSGETIQVKGAKLTIPAKQLAWQSGNDYTYILKICDNLTGAATQSVTDFYPIKLDAVIISDINNNQIVTTSF